MTELVAQSPVIVVGRAGRQTKGEDGGLPTVTTRVALQRTLRGSPPDGIRLYELAVDDSGRRAQPLDPGRDYLLFLTHFERVRGRPVAKDLFVVVGGDGGGRYVAITSGFEHVGPRNGELPAELSATAVDDLVQRP